MAREGARAGGLTPRQERFCGEYLVDLNATQAAVRAGYSARTARVQGSALLAQPVVRARVEALKRERSARVRVDADFVLSRLVELDAMDVRDVLDAHGRLLPLGAWPAVWRRSVSEVEVAEVKGVARGASRVAAAKGAVKCGVRARAQGVPEDGAAGGAPDSAPDSAVADSAVVVRKLKWPDRLKVLELIAKHVAAGAGVRGLDGDDAGEGGGVARFSEVERAARVASLLALARARQVQAQGKVQGKAGGEGSGGGERGEESGRKRGRGCGCL